MNYTAWAEKAYRILHPAYKANKNHGVPEEWLAGLVAVECSSLHPKARRFENSVFREVGKVRNGRPSTAYPGFNSGKIHAFIVKPSTDIDGLTALATSYGLGQIMGYHYFNKWNLLPSAFSELNVQDSATYTLRMMAEGMGWANKYIKTQATPEWGRNYEFLMRWWNTGRVLGKTYHPDYVDNATAARKAYKEVMNANRG